MTRGMPHLTVDAGPTTTLPSSSTTRTQPCPTMISVSYQLFISLTIDIPVSTRSWIWQTCTELGYYQTTDGGNRGIFGSTVPLESDFFSADSFIALSFIAILLISALIFSVPSTHSTTPSNLSIKFVPSMEVLIPTEEPRSASRTDHSIHGKIWVTR